MALQAPGPALAPWMSTNPGAFFPDSFNKQIPVAYELQPADSPLRRNSDRPAGPLVRLAVFALCPQWAARRRQWAVVMTAHCALACSTGSGRANKRQDPHSDGPNIQLASDWRAACHPLDNSPRPIDMKFFPRLRLRPRRRRRLRLRRGRCDAGLGREESDAKQAVATKGLSWRRYHRRPAERMMISGSGRATQLANT